MAVRRLKNGKWVADVTVGRTWDGSRDRRVVTCETKAKAQKAERALLLEKDRRRGRLTGRITFREFVDEVYWPQKTGLRANTRQGYERDLRLRLIPAFGDMDVDSINRFAIQRMISACPTRKTATNARETLSSVLGLAVEMEMIPVNPAGFRYQYPDASNLPDDHDGVWLTTFDEHRPLLEYVAERYPGEPEERIVVLGLCEGLRKVEIMGLDWEDIDLGAAELTVRHSYGQGKGGAHLTEPKTPKAKRTIPVWAYALSRMKAWGPSSGPIVAGKDGGRMSPVTAGTRIRKMVARGSYADGEPLPGVTIKSMRHSFATACVNAGVEVTKLSAIMGHADIRTTERYYVRQKISDLRTAGDAIDSALMARIGI